MEQTRVPSSKRRLKLWIRLLGVTRNTESHMRRHMRTEHDTTLPRFDVLAALYRNRAGLSMSDLSALLLVSNGNSTTVVNRLEKDGFVLRTVSEKDRRTVTVTLTPSGLAHFETLAADHEREINRLFSTLPDDAVDTLTALLKQMDREITP